MNCNEKDDDTNFWLFITQMFLSITSLTLSSVSLIVSLGAVLAFLYYQSSHDDLLQKMDDIQEEHDYLLEQNIIPEFCLKPPDPGPCTSKINRF